VLAGGGYVAGPVGLAAVARRTPLVLSEADSHLGLANRMLAPFARRVCLAFPIEGHTGDRWLLTGRPVPRAVVEADRQTARERLGVPAGATCVVVFGGSLGARSLNMVAAEALPGVGVHVLHITGTRDFAEVRARAAAGQHAPRHPAQQHARRLADAGLDEVHVPDPVRRADPLHRGPPRPRRLALRRGRHRADAGGVGEAGGGAGICGGDTRPVC